MLNELQNCLHLQGLVIKAKSMFDEPIRIGLIRFADRYDNSNRTTASKRHKDEEEEQPKQENGNERGIEATDFDMDHQPILVIYTTTAATADAEQSRP